VLGVSHGAVGEAVELALPAAVAVLGVLQAFGMIESWWWAGALIGLLVFERFVVRYRRGSALYQLLGKVRRVNTSFAGNLDDVLLAVLRSRQAGLSEETSHRLCVGLLHRLRHFAELALSTGEPLRATLAVPLVDEHNRPVALRVWCYDEPYHDRRWTRLDITLEGASAAFRTGDVKIITDIRHVAGIDRPEHRPYKSVVSIPVRAGGPNGATLAVVSIDAKDPEVFREEDVLEKLIPMIQPVVNTLAVVLALRQPGAAYEFGS
jgi:hypothetical protein